MVPEVYRRSKENRQAQRVLRQRSYYVSAMTALKNRVYAFLSQQREELRETVAWESNLFSAKGQKAILALDSASGEKRLREALLKTYRHLETRIGESTELVDLTRFADPAQLHAYAGVIPNRRQEKKGEENRKNPLHHIIIIKGNSFFVPRAAVGHKDWRRGFPLRNDDIAGLRSMSMVLN